MDNSKKAAFVRAHRIQKFAKGGAVKALPKRKYFADGGTTLGGPGTSGTVGNAVNPATSGVNGFTNMINPTGQITSQILGNSPLGQQISGIINPLGAFGNAMTDQFQASAANTQAGTNADQLNAAYTGVQGALGQQNNLVNTLAPQAQGAVNQQNYLANQYENMINGTGPNPALAQLQQQTGQNVNQQAALMAGQRGAGANAGLMARQAAQQGAATQQNAVGQAAQLQAQQQIAAQQNLANLSANQINQTGQAITGENTAQLNEQNTLENANTALNNANVGMQSNINNVNSQTAAANQNAASNIFGSLTSGISSMFAKGGEVGKDHHIKLAEMNATSLMHGMKNYDDGGEVASADTNQIAPPVAAPEPVVNLGTITPTSDSAGNLSIPSTSTLPAPQSSSGGKGGGGGGLMSLVALLAEGGKVCKGEMHGHVANFLAQGGKTEKVPAMVSPGEIYLSPEQVHKVMTEDVDPAKIGRKFAGKAKVKGDSLKNDTIPTTLDEGGCVIDRKNMGTKEKRQLFVHKSMAKKKAGG